jgi:hypothetical protein
MHREKASLQTNPTQAKPSSGTAGYQYDLCTAGFVLVVEFQEIVNMK